jgi:signal peptidase
MKIIKGIINVCSTLIIVIGLLFVSLYFLGVTPYVVLSGSMEPTIETGSLCLINSRVKYDTLKKDDVIAFKINNTMVTHRLVNINEDGFTTKGDHNNEEDGELPRANYVGKNVFWIPKLGYAVRLVQSPNGRIILGAAIMFLFISGFLFGDDKKRVKKKVYDDLEYEIKDYQE